MSSLEVLKPEVESVASHSMEGGWSGTTFFEKIRNLVQFIFGRYYFIFKQIQYTIQMLDSWIYDIFY